MTWRKWVLVGLIATMLAGCEPYSSGDRVLVTKCAYDTSITSPSRYDVVVFKYPKGPMDKNTPKNYIKRLLGLPGELIAIFFGRLYHIPAPKDQPFFDDVNKVSANELWKDQHMHVGDEKVAQMFRDGKFKILRKSPNVIMALRRIVFDNDFQSAELKKVNLHERWIPTADSAWNADDKTGFLGAAKADSVDWLRYQHLIRPEGQAQPGMKLDKMLILDTLDYNSFQTNGAGDLHGYSEAHWVGDLMVECNLEVKEAKGEFWFELSKGVDRFRACWDLTTGNCTLYREGEDKKLVKMDEKPTSVKSPGKYMLRLANVDARLTVWVNRELPFGDGVEYHPPEIAKADEGIDDDKLENRRGPTENDMQPASIGVSKNANVHVTQLRLWRDIYYRTGLRNLDSTDYAHLGIHATKEHWMKKELYTNFRKQRFVTMYVQPGHYLVLGDNSQSSADSREWGLVPERLMLGRALMVYYPVDRIGPIR